MMRGFCYLERNIPEFKNKIVLVLVENLHEKKNFLVGSKLKRFLIFNSEQIKQSFWYI